MGFFENLKVKRAAKTLGFTVEEYNEFLSVEKEGITVEQYKIYLRDYKSSLKLCDYPKILKLENSGLMPSDRIDYICHYEGKLSPKEYSEFLRLKEIGFDLHAFKNYQKTDKSDSPEVFLIKQKFQGLDLSDKDIETYIKKYTNSVTPEQYAEFLKFDNSLVNMRDYKLYLEKFSAELTLAEYTEFCRAKKVSGEFLSSGKKEKHPTDEMAINYAKNYMRISMDDFVKYYDIEHCYRDFEFHYLDKYGFDAYISFLEKGNVFDWDKEDETKQIITRHVVEYSKNYVRANSVIQNGVLKKYNGQDEMLFCVPDEVVEIAEDAFGIGCSTVSLEMLFNNAFKHIDYNETLSLYNFGTFVEGRYNEIYKYLDEHRFPDTMEYISEEIIYTIDKVKAPVSMKNCEALKDKEVEWIGESEKQSKTKVLKEVKIKTKQDEITTSPKTAETKSVKVKAEETAAKKPASVKKKTSAKSGGKDYEKIIEKLGVRFPFEASVTIRKDDVDRINNRIESMRVGDQLVVRPDKPKHADDWDVSIDIYDENGLLLGYSFSTGGTNQLHKLSDVLTAEVSEITPLSARRKGSKYALLKVKVDCDLSGNTLTASVPKPTNRFTVKYSADGKSGTKKFPDIYDAQGYVEHLLETTENGFAQILDEDGNEIPGEGAIWC